jgi:hypothetical protein
LATLDLGGLVATCRGNCGPHERELGRFKCEQYGGFIGWAKEINKRPNGLSKGRERWWLRRITVKGVLDLLRQAVEAVRQGAQGLSQVTACALGQPGFVGHAGKE